MEDVLKKARFAIPLLALALALSLTQAAFASTENPLAGGTIGTQDTGADYGYGVGADIMRADITISDGTSFEYTGSDIEPQFTVTLDGRTLRGSADFDDVNADFWYFYSNNVSVSDSAAPDEEKPQIIIATFAEDDPYVYVREAYFDITPTSIKNAKVKVANAVYTGKAVKPGVVVTYNDLTLKQDDDYTVTYKSNKKVGTGKVTIKGTGNFTGKTTATFKIKKASIQNAKFTNVKDKMYTGERITPSMKVRYGGKVLKVNRDYTIKYSNNKNAGIATIKIKGKGNLKGTQKIQFSILPRPIDNSKINVNISNALWTGSFAYPSLEVTYNGKTLTGGTDYDVRFTNNTEISANTAQKIAKATIYGKGNYTSSREAPFYVLPHPISDTSVQVTWNADTSYSAGGYPIVWYNGKGLVKGVDYTCPEPTVGESRVGTATYTTYTYKITGLGHFEGSRTYVYRKAKA